jgi:hypothetical protein
MAAADIAAETLVRTNRVTMIHAPQSLAGALPGVFAVSSDLAEPHHKEAFRGRPMRFDRKRSPLCGQRPDPTNDRLVSTNDLGNEAVAGHYGQEIEPPARRREQLSDRYSEGISGAAALPCEGV